VVARSPVLIARSRSAAVTRGSRSKVSSMSCCGAIVHLLVDVAAFGRCHGAYRAALDREDHASAVLATVRQVPAQ
jgi:hypothetical protein